MRKAKKVLLFFYYFVIISIVKEEIKKWKIIMEEVYFMEL